MYLYVSTQRCQTKYLKLFLLKTGSVCHLCQRHLWCTLNSEYLRKFSKKFETAVWDTEGLGQAHTVYAFFYIYSMVYFYMFYPKSREQGEQDMASLFCPFSGVDSLCRLNRYFVHKEEPIATLLHINSYTYTDCLHLKVNFKKRNVSICYYPKVSK